jgi:hypothetical protein
MHPASNLTCTASYLPGVKAAEAWSCNTDASNVGYACNYTFTLVYVLIPLPFAVQIIILNSNR